ncbi:uncharacterized protein BDV14DRAFT_15187 [Aspergillus stella-maris]|uniref:uncharacterized protein n=1 Tax=Aspergillus stella-maris TaxID=1810926 RepID=UPI003CCDF2C1
MAGRYVGEHSSSLSQACPRTTILALSYLARCLVTGISASSIMQLQMNSAYHFLECICSPSSLALIETRSFPYPE